LPQLFDASNIVDNGLVVPVSKTYQSTTATTCKTTTSENPTIVFKGCTFTGCSISMSGNASNENKYNYDVQELLRGIDVLSD